MMAAATTSVFKNGLKLEDCRNCGAERPVTIGLLI